MLKVTLRSFWEHKRRLVSTSSPSSSASRFMAGTFVLTDTIDRVFDDLFADVNEDSTPRSRARSCSSAGSAAATSAR